MTNYISKDAIIKRSYWVEEIRKLSGNFGNDYEKLSKELREEVIEGGASALVDHLRLCGSIPESYDHDSSEEKLYSKYTDTLLALTYQNLGLKSLVLTERADAADVEVFAKDYSFVADAKAFRLLFHSHIILWRHFRLSAVSFLAAPRASATKKGCRSYPGRTFQRVISIVRVPNPDNAKETKIKYFFFDNAS